MQKEKLDIYLSWILFGIVVFGATLIFAGLFGSVRDPKLVMANRPYLFLLGIVIGFFAAIVLAAGERFRFEREMRKLLDKPKETRSIRLPMAIRPITWDEFRAMWGDDPMPK